jgi:hypothetical protein
MLVVLAAASARAAVVARVAVEARIVSARSQTFTVTLAPAMIERKLALSLAARLDSPTLGGSTFSMQIAVNGKPVELGRLLNKPLETEMLNGLKLDWFGTGAWRVVYSPDYQAGNREDNPNCLVGGHAYEFTLDLAGLLRAGANEITIRHSEGLINNDLVLKDVALGDAPPRVASLEPREDPNAPLKRIAPRDASRVDYRVKILPHGGLAVGFGQHAFTVNSGFSYPNAGWNTLSPSRRSGEEEIWQPRWPPTGSGDSLQVAARGRSYRLVRTITRRRDHLAISDKFTNLTPADLHLSLKHMISTAGLKQSEVFVHGLRSRIGQGNDAGGDNPTVFVRAGGDGLGLVAEDDVFRAQSMQQATASPAEAGLADNYFMLGPGETYEVRWSIYPVPEGDYFDFVNAVRRNWGTNFTIPGPFAFAPHPSVERDQTPDPRSWLRHAGLGIVSLQIPMPEPMVLAHGLAFLKEPAEQQRLKEQADRLRAAVPRVKVLQYLHVYITRLDDAVRTYHDAAHLGPDGKQMTYDAGNWKPTFWLFLPTTENAYGREMNKTFDLVLDRLGFDGVYWDELAVSAQPIAHRVSDGHTAVANMQTMTIQEKVALAPLYCQGYQVQQVRRVLTAGKILIGNGEPVTQTMTRLHFPRFVEAWRPENLRNAHLYCPLGLSSPDRVRGEDDIVPSIRSHLLNGGLWYYYCGWNAVRLTRPSPAVHLFPFTPVELHEGYLIGRERILTAKSGLFGWGDNSPVRVCVFTCDGKEVTDFKAPRHKIEGKSYTELRLPQGGIGIIERVIPNGGNGSL